MYFVQEKLEKMKESDIFQVSEIFPGVLSVLWYNYFWYRHFSACNFISEGRSSYPLSGDMIIFSCRERRFRVMIDVLRDGSAYPFFWQNTSIQWFETFHMSFTK